jgi:hypothetical protein
MIVTILLIVVSQFTCQLCNALPVGHKRKTWSVGLYRFDRDLCENNNDDNICMDLILEVQIRFLWVFRQWRGDIVIDRGFDSSNSSKTKPQKNRTHDQSLHRPYSLTNNSRCTPHLSPDQKPEMNRTHDQELHISTHWPINKVGLFLRAFPSNRGWERRRGDAPPPLSTAKQASVFFKMPPAACLSSYVSESNVVAKVIDSTINLTPCIAQAKPLEIIRTLVFHLFLETTP